MASLLVRQVLYISLFAMWGCLARIFVGLLFDYEGTSVLSITTAEGALFHDIVANSIGCFIMGILSPGDLIKMSTDKVAVFPHATHAWAGATAIHLGLRTGFCGSLTTYASWNAEMVITLCSGLWVTTVFGYVIGIYTSFGFLVLGMHTAVSIRRRMEKHQERRTATSVSMRKSVSSKGDMQAKLLDYEAPPFGEEEAVAVPPAPPPPPPEATPLTDAVAWVLLVITVAGAVLGCIINTQSNTTFTRRPQFWFAMLMAPFGALARWRLSLYNGKALFSWLKPWVWIPIGTYLANLIASILSSLIYAVTDESPGQYWFDIIFMAIGIGFCGCLSTVSTFVVEIYKLLPTMGQGSARKGFLYTLFSFTTTCAAGVAVYAWSV